MTTKKENSEVQTLSFYTIGKDFTRLIRDFINEGSFHTAYEILTDGGLTDKGMIQAFFLNKLAFEGDTREGDHCLSVVPCKGLQIDELTRHIYYGLQSALKDARIDFTDLYQAYYRVSDENEDNEKYRESGKYKNFYAFSKVFSLEEIRAFIGLEILKEEGFDVNPDLKGVEPSNFTGVILPTGDIVRCGHQEHRDLYPLLSALDYASSEDWTDDTQVIHVSTGQLSGGVANAIKHFEYASEDELPTDAQIETCFRIRTALSGLYGEYEGVVKNILDYVADSTNHGGKFNNLTFLDRFYDFKLPKFSKEKFDGACIRTSPKYSMAGLLNSKFSVTNYERAIKEIEADFDKYKAVVGAYKPYNSDELKIGNKLHFFYQEFLEGKNGVCHYWVEDKRFSYSVSDNQGDVVQGKKLDDVLPRSIEQELERIAKTLATDFDNSVQIEFVVNAVSGIHIVQLRLLDNNARDFEVNYSEDEIIHRGKSFSAGYLEADIEDVLIVDSDCDSELLIGKKALIVREDVEFSHVLALSKSLKIPSIYAVGDFDFGDKLRMSTDYIDGVILKDK